MEVAMPIIIVAFIQIICASSFLGCGARHAASSRKSFFSADLRIRSTSFSGVSAPSGAPAARLGAGASAIDRRAMRPTAVELRRAFACIEASLGLERRGRELFRASGGKTKSAGRISRRRREPKPQVANAPVAGAGRGGLCPPLELAVENGPQLVQSLAVTTLPGLEETGDLAGIPIALHRRFRPRATRTGR